ncbi:MAG: terminase small subunit [Clostridia bacterium]|nr:terminase small subunit [Clostridia bacterium]MCI8980003.1 terminase small subunit [Clostridia bacterium]MCI9086823.1 terminase small subunit [Clostridia bacterium]
MNGKKLRFFEALIADPTITQTKAAIIAGYSEKTAAQQASRLMKDPEIIAALDGWTKKQHEKNTARADEVIEFLTSVMRGETVDNIPLFIGDGEQELTEGAPSAKDRLRAAEMLGKYYALFTDKHSVDAEGVVQIIDDIPGGGADVETD